MKGLGAVLEQKHNDSWYPIGYASRSLTSAERNCCQLKKKILLTVFVCHKFHNSIYGKIFCVQQPLTITWFKLTFQSCIVKNYMVKMS